MLSCKDVTKLADDLVEKKLPFSRRVSIQLHLFICVRCRAYVDQVRKTVATLNVMGKTDKADAETVKKTLESLQEQGLGPKSK